MDPRATPCLCSLDFWAAESPKLKASRATWLREEKPLDEFSHPENFPKELILLLPFPHCYHVTMFALRILGNSEPLLPVLRSFWRPANPHSFLRGFILSLFFLIIKQNPGSLQRVLTETRPLASQMAFLHWPFFLLSYGTLTSQQGGVPTGSIHV